jgi:hypothetical protein
MQDRSESRRRDLQCLPHLCKLLRRRAAFEQAHQGGDVASSRRRTHRTFWRGGVVEPDCNLQGRLAQGDIRACDSDSVYDDAGTFGGRGRD